MDFMQRDTEELENIKDTNLSIKDSVSPNTVSFTYNKLDKLVSALYIVTDIIDRDEPIRKKLRSVANDLISDISLLKVNKTDRIVLNNISKISEIISFLDIAHSVHIISEMNSSVLKREFVLLRSALEALLNNDYFSNSNFKIENLLKTEKEEIKKEIKDNIQNIKLNNEKNTPNFIKKDFIRHLTPTTLGVQKGHTLMQAISDKISPQAKDMSFVKEKASINNEKKDRKDIILNILKSKTDGLTITEIKNSAYGPLKDLGEKTLQREILSLLSTGVLYKKGEKRWSKYFVKS